MGEQTAVLQLSDTTEVELALTARVQRQIEQMPEQVRALAQVALASFAYRLGDYLAQEVEHVSFIGRTREEIFAIRFEVFGPRRATVFDIVLELDPIDESAGWFRLERNGTVHLLPIPSSRLPESGHLDLPRVDRDSTDPAAFGDSLFGIGSDFFSPAVLQPAPADRALSRSVCNAIVVGAEGGGLLARMVHACAADAKGKVKAQAALRPDLSLPRLLLYPAHTHSPASGAQPILLIEVRPDCGGFDAAR
ncbi:MAG: hypothetical protein J0M19_06100 [Sphingomonadales bacterium]|nr:hypothetical protein [Sphingomonadales bacterium]